MAETDWCLVVMAVFSISILLFCGKYTYRCIVEKILSDREIKRLKRRYFKGTRYAGRR